MIFLMPTVHLFENKYYSNKNSNNRYNYNDLDRICIKFEIV
jgi:hypothetical protein